jgi:hypothetical protein
MGNIRKSYTSSDKLKIITYAEADGNRAAGREYDVGESNIRLWRYQKERLQKLPRSKMAERGKTAQFPDLEIELVKWITDRRMQGYAISTAELKLKATHLARQSYTTANFRGSISWRYAFLKRHDLSIRRGTNIAQKLPSDYQEQLTKFQSFIIKLRKKKDYSLSQIGNADQTPITFDLPSATTITTKGAKSISMPTTGNEKNRFTVIWHAQQTVVNYLHTSYSKEIPCQNYHFRKA